jgi:nicotinate-nucleotide--dimethylbenzimidazole phosphoribosyltransferase
MNAANEIATVGSDLDDVISRAIDAKTKPLGALGRLESLAFLIARIQRTVKPSMDRCQLTVFAADHGIAVHDVSAYPQAVTRQMVLNFLDGGAACNVFAKLHGVDIQVVDAGVAGPPIDSPHLLSRRIGEGTGDSLHRPAMTREQFVSALSQGVEIGRRAPGQASALGEMGIANSSSAALVAHKLTDHSLADLCGCGTGLDSAGLARKIRVLGLAAQRTPRRLSPQEALEHYGGFETVMMTGAMLGAAAKGKVVIVDGYIATSSALAAVALAPACRDYMVFAHKSGEHGHTAMLQSLKALPLLHLGLRLGEGTGALLAWPLLRAAAAMMSGMASFEEAQVSGPL